VGTRTQQDALRSATPAIARPGSGHAALPGAQLLGDRVTGLARADGRVLKSTEGKRVTMLFADIMQVVTSSR